MTAKVRKHTKTLYQKLPPEYEKAKRLLMILKDSSILADRYECKELGEVEYLELWDTLLKLAKDGHI